MAVPKTPAAPSRGHAPVVASLMTAVAMLVWAGHDVLLKLLSNDYSQAQILFMGRILTVPMAFLIVVRSHGLHALWPKRPAMHLARAAAGLSDMALFLAAIALTSLANAITITFATPLIMMALSVLFLGEKVGWRRWTAVGVGFLGVVVVLQPTGAGMGLASVFALGSAVTYAVFLTLTRAMTASEHVGAMILWNSVLVSLATGLAMIPYWRTPPVEELWLIGLLAGTAALGQWMTTAAYRLAEASLLAPLLYTALLWAVLFGYLVFGDVPTPTLLAGAAIIIASTLYIVQREARLKRLRASAPDVS